MPIIGVLDQEGIELLNREIAGRKMTGVIWNPEVLVRHMNTWVNEIPVDRALSLIDSIPVVGLRLDDGRYLLAINLPYRVGWGLIDDSPDLPWKSLDCQAAILAARVDDLDEQFGNRLCLDHAVDPHDPLTFGVVQGKSPWANFTHFPLSVFGQYIKKENP